MNNEGKRTPEQLIKVIASVLAQLEEVGIVGALIVTDRNIGADLTARAPSIQASAFIGGLSSELNTLERVDLINSLHRLGDLILSTWKEGIAEGAKEKGLDKEGTDDLLRGLDRLLDGRTASETFCTDPSDPSAVKEACAKIDEKMEELCGSRETPE